MNDELEGGSVLNHLVDRYPNIHLSYEQLDAFSFPTAEPFILTVHWNGVKFEFLIRMREQSANLLVLGSGAMETQEKPPFFQRHSWMDEFEDSLIYYNDPTLYLGNIPVGWGQGTWDRFYLQDIAVILAKLIEKARIHPQNVLFYGSSAGGFMSLILAGYIRGSTALVNCPQTCLTRWLEVPVQHVFNLSYPGLSIPEVMQIFPERINVMKFYNRIKYVPKIYYLQNAACEYDMTHHLLPFLSDLQFLEDGCVVNPVIVDLYYDKQPGPAVLPALGGHGALGKAETVRYIHQVKQMMTQ